MADGRRELALRAAPSRFLSPCRRRGRIDTASSIIVPSGIPHKYATLSNIH